MTRRVLLLALALALAVLVGCSHQQHSSSPATTMSGRCAPPATYLALGHPDPCLTPGVIRTSDPAVICQRGYATRTRQELTSAEWFVRRAQVLGAYGLARNPGEVDHFLPLEGGGTNDVENLWPESAPQYKAKDAAERGLHAGICKPGVTVAKAQALQQAFLKQWGGP